MKLEYNYKEVEKFENGHIDKYHFQIIKDDGDILNFYTYGDLSGFCLTYIRNKVKKAKKREII